MKIRKIVYNIDYIHVLTFKEHYKAIIGPYFEYEPLEYGIDNEGTMNESIRLIFKNEGFILQFRKEGILMLFEGDISEVKRNNAVVDVFFDIYEKIKKIDGFCKTKRHRIVIDAVTIDEKTIVEPQLENNMYLKNPFGKLEEFGTILQFERDSKKCKLHFGNYLEKDIKQYNLTPLNTEYNKDLIGNVGFMCQTTVGEEITNSSFSKFKSLLKEGEDIIHLYTQK
jgi:hypothetical protein